MDPWSGSFSYEFELFKNHTDPTGSGFATLPSQFYFFSRYLLLKFLPLKVVICINNGLLSHVLRMVVFTRIKFRGFPAYPIVYRLDQSRYIVTCKKNRCLANAEEVVNTTKVSYRTFHPVFYSFLNVSLWPTGST